MAQQSSPFFTFYGVLPEENSALIDERIASAQGLQLLEAASWTAGKATLGTQAATDAQKQFYSSIAKVRTRAERIAAAHAALAAAPCADAHTLLAGEEAKDLNVALKHTEEAVQIAQEGLNGALPTWDLIPTRPYLRALQAHASALLALKQPEKVTALLAKLPFVTTDVLGLQLLLVVAHLRREQWDAARKLIDARAARTTPPMSAAWLWAAAVQAEQASRASLDSSSALAKALRACPHVPYLLLKKRALTPVPPLAAPEGSEAEADVIVNGLQTDLCDARFESWLRLALSAGLALHPCSACAQTIATALAREARIDAAMKNKKWEEAEKEISKGGENLPPMHPLKLHFLSRYAELLAMNDHADKAHQIAHAGLHMDIISFTRMAAQSLPEAERAQVQAAGELCQELNVALRERLLAAWKKCTGKEFLAEEHTECQKKFNQHMMQQQQQQQHGHSHGGQPCHGHGGGGSSHGHSHAAPSSCSSCGASGKNLALCGGCQRVAYCSRECQKKAWPTHKTVCKQLAAGACAPGEHGHGYGEHGHSHGGQACHGHGEQGHHGHSHDSHGHSHGGQPCHGHGEQQHGHSHGGGDHGHSHDSHGHRGHSHSGADHGHSHGDGDDHGHSHGDGKGSLHSLD